MSNSCVRWLSPSLMHARPSKLQRILVLEVRCCWNILCISFLDRIANEQARETIRHLVGPHEDLTTAKKRELRCYGHVARSSGFAKTICRAQRKKERQAKGKRWVNNVKELTGKPV